MTKDFGFVDLFDSTRVHLALVDSRARAVSLLLERIDTDDWMRAHTLRYEGHHERAIQFVGDCQRVYFAARCRENQA